MELMNRSGVELAAMIRSKEVSPVEVVDAALDTIEARNPAVNAFVFVAPEESRASALEAEKAVMRGDELGVFHGVPTALKDLYDFKPGWPATYGGVRMLKDNISDNSCAWCRRMEGAGAIVIGKTNSQFLGFSGVTDNPLFGATNNPFDLSKNAGGSSGGASAAVAEGLIPFAEATDAGGSSREPASWCGVVGFKPTWGSTSYLSRPNAFIGAGSFPAEGVMARTIDDIAASLGVLIGPEPRDPHNAGVLLKYVDTPEASMKGVRIAFNPNLDVFAVAPEVAVVVAEAVKAFEQAGAIVDQIPFGITRDQRELSDAFYALALPGSVLGLEGFKAQGFDLLASDPADLPPDWVQGIEEGRNYSFADVAAAQVVRTEVFDAIENVYDNYDLIITPTVGIVAIPNATEGLTIGPDEVNGVKVHTGVGWTLTYPFNMTGHPAMSVPAGMTPEGLPVGMQIIGRRFRDAEVVNAGRALEQIRPWAASYERLVSAGQTTSA
jgi:amidase/aspartyl-tRNA(Asn)/glutamyl-tRNA(Gln) amidotransferase subunit A